MPVQPSAVPAGAVVGGLAVVGALAGAGALAEAGALTGGAMEGKGPARNWGSLVIALDPILFGTLEEFQANANIMCGRVKNAKILPDQSEGSSINLPGERGDALEEENLQKGTLELSDEVYNALKDAQRFVPKA